MRTCWRCRGDGEIAYNPSRLNDPQEERSARCNVCHGEGEIEDGVTLEELRALVPGFVYDVTLIGEDHPLAARVKHPGATFRFEYEYMQPELVLGVRPDRPIDPLQMTNPVAYMIWGKAVVDGVPEHIFSAPAVKDPEARAVLRYGFNSWLIGDVELPNG